MKVTRILNDNDVLFVLQKEHEYHATLKSDTRNIGFDDDSGKIEPNETISDIADQLEMWMNSNLTL